MENKMQDSKREEAIEKILGEFLENNQKFEISRNPEIGSNGWCFNVATKKLQHIIDSEISKARKEILERVALETRANVCDCGDEWKDSDLSVWVESELDKLSGKGTK